MVYKYKLLGKNIALDIESGAIHEIDDCAYDILDFYPDKSAEEIIYALSNKYTEDQINSCILEIDSLIENGLLFTPDETKNEADAETTGPQIVKALCLHAAHDCNLKCAYCFAKEGGYRGERQLMSAETGITAVDFLIKNSGGRKNLEIDFFGGEPLMNIEAVKKIVSHCREAEKRHGKRFRFTLTTNGILLNEKEIDFINGEMDNVVLSLDGRKKINDGMRKKMNGAGSYGAALPKFKNLVEKRNGERYFIRGTFTRKNLDFSEDVKHIAGLGFKRISVEPVVAPDSEDFAIKNTDVEKINNEYEKLTAHMMKMMNTEDEFDFFHFNIDLEGGPCLKKRVTGCGAGVEYMAVAPDGKLYPCHQFVGMDEFILGDVFNGIKNNEMRSIFKKSNLYAKPECSACWVKYYCGGGCAANAYNMNGDINVPYAIGCELHIKRVECAILFAAFRTND